MQSRDLRTALVALTLTAVTGAMFVGCATTPRAEQTSNQGLRCQRDQQDIICAAPIDETTSVVIAYGLERLWTIKLTTLALPQGSAQTLIARKRDEDQRIYNDPARASAAIIAAKHKGSAADFLKQAAIDEGYQGSFWQRLSATLASERTRGELTSEQWLEADPLLGTAGNGPDFVFKGVPGLDGAAPGSWTSRIAAAHDADWSLGRYLNIGPLALYLAPKRIGGEAPAEYQDTLGLAGLGNVLCSPGKTCDWYVFNPSGLGGPYARPFMHHPDWRIIDEDIEQLPATACVEHEGKQWCWCLAQSSMAAGACPSS